MKDQLCEALLRSFEQLVNEDAHLFDCPIEEYPPEYDARKLHEVCVNHRLANHFEVELLTLLADEREKMFVDIEFNREGVDFRNVTIDGEEGQA